MIPPNEPNASFRQRTAPQHASPSFKIFSPTEMQDWERRRSFSGQSPPNYKSQQDSGFFSYFRSIFKSSPNRTRPICKYLIYAIILLILIISLVFFFSRFFSKPRAIISNLHGVERIQSIPISQSIGSKSVEELVNQNVQQEIRNNQPNIKTVPNPPAIELNDDNSYSNNKKDSLSSTNEVKSTINEKKDIQDNNSIPDDNLSWQEKPEVITVESSDSQRQSPDIVQQHSTPPQQGFPQPPHPGVHQAFNQQNQQYNQQNQQYNQQNQQNQQYNQQYNQQNQQYNQQNNQPINQQYSQQQVPNPIHNQPQYGSQSAQPIGTQYNNNLQNNILNQLPLNISINEFPQQALHHILESVLYSKERPKDMTLLHFSSHFDLEVPYLLHGSFLKSWKKFSSNISTRAYIMPLVYLGLVKRIIWIRPSWARTNLQDHRIYKFTIGNVGDSEKLAIDNIDIVKAGILSSGYSSSNYLTNRRIGEIVVVDGEQVTEAARDHPDILMSTILGISPTESIAWNIDASYFTARNPFLNWLNSEDASHHDQFNIHAAISIFNPESYCMDQVTGDIERAEFANAFRAFYRSSERHQLRPGAYHRLKNAIQPFWCNQLQLGNAMKNFHILIQTVIHDEELSSDPDLHNIVERLRELNVYPHHISNDQQKDLLFSSMEFLISTITNKLGKNPFSLSMILSAKEKLINKEEKEPIVNRLQNMLKRLFSNSLFVSDPEGQIYPHSISPLELQSTENDDQEKIGYFESKMNEKRNRNRRKVKREIPEEEKRDIRKLRKQRELISHQMQVEAEKRRKDQNVPPGYRNDNSDFEFMEDFDEYR